MRGFVAIEVPGASAVPGSPTGHAPEHLTLRFLGEVDAPTVARVSEALAGVAARFAPFELTLAGVGAFPDPARPRVVYVDVAEGRSEVVRLAADVQAAFSAVGIPPEDRPFVPHVTVLRVRSSRDRDRAHRLFEELGGRTIASTTVRELLLKESDLRPEGAVHHVVGRWTLGPTVPPP
ncbi:MAG TPA: RNA 2',3'-cyclic phosphodiesterase [Thermoplasmata archaeon]|nr:RNA 2',3'-cyclic phosphodiesterase [Thermoplasmata archaeon]